MANNKLVILAATLAALVVLTQATFKTTVITTEVESEFDTSNTMYGQCSRQLSEQWPDRCEQYMRSSMRQYIDPSREKEQFNMCCDELKMMKPQCQCEAMKMMMKDMHMGGSQMTMMKKAMMIPMMCGYMQHECPMTTM